MKTSPVRYTIRPADPAAHRFEIACVILTPDPEGQQFSLPAWIPGSYLIRDFSRHLIALRAESAGQAIPLQQRDKHRWQAAALPAGQTLTLHYEVYAWDLSVRTAHLDETHGFFNGTSVFLRVHGQEHRPCHVDIQPPAGPAFQHWRVATALERAHSAPDCAAPQGFGLYQAANYDELIDHPVEMGEFTLATFTACGVPHEIAITGQHDCDLERLCADLQRLCTWQIRFFGEPAPMTRYVFLVMAVGEGYGGLEHRASTALLCSRHDLPWRGMTTMTEGYRSFLGLCSHEYFHTWHVKRIRPAAFTPYDLTQENYTRLLWVFEGFTSYYDDLALLRSGVITLTDWLELTAKTLSNVQRTPGRLRQSLSESSFNAWHKFYKPDENTPNVVVSYYSKGALTALALDLSLRRQTAHRVSLDTLMHALWQGYGQSGTGISEDAIQPLAETLSGQDLSRFFADFVDGTHELPLQELLADFAIELRWEGSTTPSLGVKTENHGNEVRLATVYDGSAAQAAGLSAGDWLLAINGLRVTPASLEKQLMRHQAGATLQVHVFRRDELRQFSVRLDPPATENARLSGTGKAGWPV